VDCRVLSGGERQRINLAAGTRDQAKLATRVILLADGQAVASGTADEILGELEAA
jgi:ABC-type hemin transport system ATPase subunit